MAIFTPKGLKIRLSIDYSFALMSRLYPKIKAFDVLRTTEAFEVLPAVWTVIAAVILFATRQPALYIALCVLSVQVYFHFSRISGFMPGRFFVSVSRGLSPVYGYGILTVLILLLGWFTVHLEGLAAFYIGKLLASIVNATISHVHESRVHKNTGIAVTMSEINFLNSYRYYARALRQSEDFAVSDAELAEDNWQACFLNLSMEWPVVVRRFTTD